MIIFEDKKYELFFSNKLPPLVALNYADDLFFAEFEKLCGTKYRILSVIRKGWQEKYIPAMKKASAIVTETGGITSHAAIISRELGTPCVIRVREVTKILQDGDKIEVDADEGKIRII
ncbi:MAG: hypothetical protein HQ530_00765 [Parcubacteria group bacterium]|nr:hypothetical protein [Parcubacteria group bacterium]